MGRGLGVFVSKMLNRKESQVESQGYEYRLELALKGLILQPALVELDTYMRLRKPTWKDFATEIPKRLHREREPFLIEDPTAFLYARTVLAEGDDKALFAFEDEIRKGVTVLRLFRVGAVEKMWGIRDVNSVTHFEPYWYTETTSLGTDKYLIANEDIDSLKKFWSNMKNVNLPFHEPDKEPNELSIAFERYHDSLPEGVLEKRIFSAIIGLEALYLNPSEQQEMSYRLRMRVGKLLGLIGYNPDEIRRNLTDGYDIRSTYVHGGILKQKGRKKLEEKYGDLNEFSKRIVDYLRASIVVLLRRPKKTSLIEKIDASFLDSKKENEVKKLLFMPYEKEVT